MKTPPMARIAVSAIAVILLSGAALEKEEKTMNVRTATKAGSWYAREPEVLGLELDEYLAKAPDADPGRPMALVCPHAGYAYSGQAAAAGYRLASRYAYDRVILLAPNHYLPGLSGPSVVDVSACHTPLGRVAVDRGIVAQLKQNPLFDSSHGGHEEEHSLELQLPFLVKALGPDFKLVPLVVGELDAAGIRRTADALTPFVDERTLIVASSDFTHYGSRFQYTPFRIPEELERKERDAFVEERIRALDFGAIGPICQRDAEGFLNHVAATRGTICGRVPIAIALEMLPGDAEGLLLDYYTSASLDAGPAFGASPWDHSVSYASIAFVRNSGYLGREEQDALLEIARKSIARVFDKSRPAPVEDPDALPAKLKRVQGAFVTLTLQHQLRGCVGHIEGRMPLYRTVEENAVNAAFRDLRFAQLSPEEFDRVRIEISVLSPLEPVASWQEIEVGRHGMVLKKGSQQAVFLPHVATEQGWDLETTLTHLAGKAGLSPNAWKSGCEYDVFTAQVFHE